MSLKNLLRKKSVNQTWKNQTNSTERLAFQCASDQWESCEATVMESINFDFNLRFWLNAYSDWMFDSIDGIRLFGVTSNGIERGKKVIWKNFRLKMYVRSQTNKKRMRKCGGLSYGNLSTLSPALKGVRLAYEILESVHYESQEINELLFKYCTIIQMDSISIS